MQSSLEFFCEECGAANTEDAIYCVACKQLLSRSPNSLPAPAPVKPVVVAPPTTLQVTANSDFSDVLPPGTLLQNRYKIEGKIGQGGYSVVYKARDTRHRGRSVAIKQINLRNMSPRQVIEATETFNRETTLLPSLRYKGIPRFYNHFTDPEHWYLVMEYIPGQTLEDYLQKLPGGCSVKETLKIGMALSSILDYLHSQKPPVIFRDVKPSNIMLTPNRKVYLIDFGIARVFNPNKAKDTTPLGSPGYAAPEQYGRQQSNQHTDIYGLGATLQTLLTGCDPLDLRAGASPRSARPLPRHVEKLLHTMMDPDPGRRPRTMSVVRQNLQEALARTRRLSLYVLGVMLGLVFLLWGGATFFVESGQVFTYNSTVSTLLVGSTCLWVLAGFTGFIATLLFLLTPSKRYVAFGILTVIMLAVIAISLVLAFFWTAPGPRLLH
ncbi:MAG TPA: protein kinase [Ktedonobacteraceae bacterium]|nr:protein kinase [Ktedonobacteraceae bacterium]